MPLDQADLDAIRALFREELAQLNARTQEIERKIDLQPDLDFLSRSELAQQVVHALKMQAARSGTLPMAGERILVPTDRPGRGDRSRSLP
jgi:hypothetical protein